MTNLAHRVIDYCRTVAAFTETAGCTTRTFLSPPMKDVHRLLRNWMERLGMQVFVDPAGNLRGLHGSPSTPRLLVGSHLDTVPNAGAFDGVLGVVLGIALAELEHDIPLEVIGFSEEEGVRFGFPFIGSKALTGELTGAMLNHRDHQGISLEQAIRNFGLDPAELPSARLAPHTAGYLEFHIEQGPVLESLGVSLGVVDAIVGQSRFLLTFQGTANHAGTTPMYLRRDPLIAASEWICQVEAYAKQHHGLVATVGCLNVSPNVGNVVPGEVRASLDVRHPDDPQRHRAVRDLLAQAQGICEARGIALDFDERLNQPAVILNRTMSNALTAAVGPTAHRMTSGAGHDAMILAPHIPSAMLFLRSLGGISHHPDEAVLVSDVEAALIAGARFLNHFRANHA